ncbi:hypothetical protein [Flavobacterium suzhouense]|uniref:Tetratricopeptide repeat protein n=1 Tax=Flavobacterium suzhouense TaxID=1529638 RepID=A0ABW5NWU2_9FLAO
MSLIKRFLLIFTLCLSYFANAQKNDYKAYSHYLILSDITSNLDSSIFYIEKAINVAEPFAEDFRQLSFLYFKKGNVKKAKKAFFSAVNAGYQLEKDDKFNDKAFKLDYDSSYLNTADKTKFGMFVQDLWNSRKKAIRKLRDNYLKRNLKTDDEIFEAMLQNENYFQSLRFMFYDNKVNDSVAFPYIAKYGPSPNSYYMLDLLKSDLFPHRRNCARFNGLTITMLLNHGVSGFLNKQDAEEFITILWNLVIRGDLKPREYAAAYDQYVQFFIQPDKNMLGTTRYRDEEGNSRIMDLIDPGHVNEIRKKYWLDSIQNYCEQYNVKLPKNYE